MAEQMIVLVPYTRLRPRVIDAIAAQGYHPITHDVSASDEAYWELLSGVWRRGETFCVVEHDVVPRPGVLDELAECPGAWCSFEYPYLGGRHAGLGCARFSAELLARIPDALERVGELTGDDHHPPRHWCRLDAWLQDILRCSGAETCVHGPPLEHVRESDGLVRPSHGCWR